MPCSEKRARLLLTRGRAVAHRRYPFTIRLKDRVGGDVQPVRVKIDPGSKIMGIAIITEEDGNKPAKVLCLFELVHRGRQISQSLRTGDMVRAEVPPGEKAAIHVGRVAVRASGSFRVGDADGINAKFCKPLHRADGHGYARRPALPPPAETGGLRPGRLT
jgi:hypothetical protein